MLIILQFTIIPVYSSYHYICDMKYLIKSKDQELNLDYDGKQYTINDKIVTPDILKTGDNQYSLIIDDQSFYAEIIERDDLKKTMTVSINGNHYELELSDKYDQLLSRLGFESSDSTKIKELKAPMPGLVLKIMVEVGDAVALDDQLLLLEAMKMENVIKSPGEGIIASIKIKAGEAVEKNQIMIVFE